MKIDVVDKTRYPNPFRSIFYELVFKGNGGAMPMIFFLSCLLGVFIFCLQMKEHISTKYIGLVLPPLVFAIPFLLAFVSYYSKILFFGENYKIDFFGLTYFKGRLGDIIELHKLKEFGGCFRVRVKGFSEKSGFLIHWTYVPEPFKNLPIIDVVRGDE